MLKAVLLDLDNTLVLFDETGFYLRYMERIIPYFADIMSADAFRDRLLKGIRDLAGNDGTLSNSQHFMNRFCTGYEDQRTLIWNRFMAFYETEYDRIPVSAKVPEGLLPLLDQLQTWGLRLVLATNPLFPEIAQRKRLAWAEVDPGRFELLTHLDNMSYVKPRAEYYRQICAKIGVSPRQCLMVGNDTVNDMVAGTAGMTTYLTTEAETIDYGAVTNARAARRGDDHPADFSGPLAGVAAVVAHLQVGINGRER